MPQFYDKMDTIYIVLNSDDSLGTDGEHNDCRYNVKIGGLLQNYEKYRLYVDNFSLDTNGIPLDTGLQVVINVGQSRSYNSLTDGTNNTILTLWKVDTSSTRDGFNYDGSTKPIEIDTLPVGEIIVSIQNCQGNKLDMATNSNFWTLTMRVDMYNSVASEPLQAVQNFNKNKY